MRISKVEFERQHVLMNIQMVSLCSSTLQVLKWSLGDCLSFEFGVAPRTAIPAPDRLAHTAKPHLFTIRTSLAIYPQY